MQDRSLPHLCFLPDERSFYHSFVIKHSPGQDGDNRMASTNTYESIAKYLTGAPNTAELVHGSLATTKSDASGMPLNPIGAIPTPTPLKPNMQESPLNECEDEVQHSHGQTPSFSGSAWASQLLSGNEETRS